jgi:predicted nucleic acid-binding protein
MGLFSSNHSPAGIILDTSVVINLSASGYGPSILKAIPVPTFVSRTARDELESGAAFGRTDIERLEEWQSAGLLQIANMTTSSLTTFESLISGPTGETLDDGEAATIACAHEKDWIAVVDERKAVRVARDRFVHLGLASTVDILLSSPVESALGAKERTTALVNALINARMRVQPQHLDLVLDLIGSDIAAGCLSLPRSRRNRQ